MEIKQIKKKAALMSIFSNSTLILLKFIVGITIGSISIISEALHSFMDLIASFLAYFSIKAASEPADTEHQFGHGKFEDMSGWLEGILILLASFIIIFESVKKILHHSITGIEPLPGIWVMLFSMLVNILVSGYLFRTAQKTDSMALLADAEHLRTDVYTSLGVLLGLIIIKITHINILDPIIAMFVAFIIFKAGFAICWQAGKNLLDTSLPEAEREIIYNLIKNYIPDRVIDIEELKTRKAGYEKIIEFNLIVPSVITVKEAHEICDELENDIKSKINNIDITIHIEPCDEICDKCGFYHKNGKKCYE